MARRGKILAAGIAGTAALGGAGLTYHYTKKAFRKNPYKKINVGGIKIKKASGKMPPLSDLASKKERNICKEWREGKISVKNLDYINKNKKIFQRLLNDGYIQPASANRHEWSQLLNHPISERVPDHVKEGVATLKDMHETLPRIHSPPEHLEHFVDPHTTPAPEHVDPHTVTEHIEPHIAPSFINTAEEVIEHIKL